MARTQRGSSGGGRGSGGPPRRALLVINSGSATLKFSLFDDDEPQRPPVRGLFEMGYYPRLVAHADGVVVTRREWPPGTRLTHADAIALLLTSRRAGFIASECVTAVGHRVVHGGARLAPTIIDAAVLAELEALVPLAPLHQPQTLAAITAVAAQAPELTQVACFDTSFHRTQPREAQAFALPRHYADEGIRRYGFHGLSFEYVASVLRRHDSLAATGRTVVAHLGNGASLCALAGGRSVATTMGFTALDGLVMGTRCGALDPGVLLHLIERHRLDASALRHLLYQESGLLGVSGISSDMRVLLGSAEPRAAEAVDLFVYRIGRELGSMAAALKGLDAIAFTGGIGENSAVLRARVCQDAAWLGVELDEAANAQGGPCISRPDSRVTAWVIPTDEEALIAAHTRRLIAERPRAGVH
jgi:acetate kinase